MKIKSGMVSFICLSVSGVMAANAATSLAAVPITEVVLYPDSATVVRTAHVTPGMTQLELKDLPANFDRETLRVQADAGVHIGQVVTQDVGRAEATGSREADIDAKIQALRDKEALLDVDAKSAQLVQHYLEGLSGAGAAATDRAQPYIDAKSMAAVIDTIRHSAAESFERIQKVEIQKREIDAAIGALQRDLEHVRSGDKDARSIAVSLAVEQAGVVRVSYQVNGANWHPRYRAMLNSTTSTLTLERLASISQKTGEDWSGIKLTLSTGRPRLSPEAPNPIPRLLSYRAQGVELIGNEELGGGLQRSFLSKAAVPASAPAPAPMPAAAPYREEPAIVQQDNAFVTEFDVPTHVTLPADGRAIAVSLSSQALTVKQRVRVVPRIDHTAVLTAEAERPAGVWLNGNIQLFRDGNYVGSTLWHAQESEALMFPFGRDDLVRVTVDRAKQQSGTTGFLSKSGERHVADVYTLTNLHKTPTDLIVLESSPVSTSDEVKVQSSFVPKPDIASWEQRQGVVGWEKVVAPKESMKINIDYDITYPEHGMVDGLP